MKKSFYLCTFGCRCNQADSNEMRARLGDSSLLEAARHTDADIIVINSCTVTRRADQQVRQTVRRLHRENPGAKLIVTGCYAERDPDTVAAIPGVTLVLGNADRERLHEILCTNPTIVGKVIRSPLPAEPECEITGASHSGRTRPYVKLQDGCDAGCSYCIVPSVRGPGRSAAPDKILAAIRSLVEEGYQEIVLTGVHLGSYGRKLSPRFRLPDLVRRILAIPGLGRIRLSSIEPMDFDKSLVALAAGSEAFAPHFHIPVQSGSDRILRLMRRPYSAARYLDLLHFIQAGLPRVGLGTDVLVGFPGETEEDFEATLNLVRAAPLSYLHVFPFSPREGTDAFSMPGSVPPPIVQKRCEILRKMSVERNLSFRRRFLSQVLPAISLAKEEAMGESVALTDNYIEVRISGPPVPSNRPIRLRIDEVRPEGTYATVCVSD